MAPILHLSRKLVQEPLVEPIADVAIRTYASESDIDRWIELRTKSFADQAPAVRPWTRADFAAEFLDKPWWSPERMWFAEAESVVGSVTLAFRGPKGKQTPVVHWLIVLPDRRRRGIGTLLMATLELACWNAGHRRIALETHAGWSAAETFYRGLGYKRDDT
jgi:GNAT superfamily N-acetyltransferase